MFKSKTKTRTRKLKTGPKRKNKSGQYDKRLRDNKSTKGNTNGMKAALPLRKKRKR